MRDRRSLDTDLLHAGNQAYPGLVGNSTQSGRTSPSPTPAGTAPWPPAPPPRSARLLLPAAPTPPPPSSTAPPAPTAAAGPHRPPARLAPRPDHRPHPRRRAPRRRLRPHPRRPAAAAPAPPASACQANPPSFSVAQGTSEVFGVSLSASPTTPITVALLANTAGNSGPVRVGQGELHHAVVQRLEPAAAGHGGGQLLRDRAATFTVIAPGCTSVTVTGTETAAVAGRPRRMW